MKPPWKSNWDSCKIHPFPFSKSTSNTFLLHSILVLFILQYASSGSSVCNITQMFEVLEAAQCSPDNNFLEKAVYILFDVNLPEGFNLRRDVYVRLAVFVRNLQKQVGWEHVKLVLAPFPRLYHWKSSDIYQSHVLWSRFFDISSMKAFAPVLDFDEFIMEVFPSLYNPNVIPITQAYQLQPFKDIFDNGVFRDKFQHINCTSHKYLPGTLLERRIFTIENFTCLKFQGGASLLGKAFVGSVQRLKGAPKLFAILNAEIVLHDRWSDEIFWMARRSMRFNQQLVEIANKYRLEHFNSTDISEAVQRPSNWLDEKPYRGAVGGDYLCAHIRRGDFAESRQDTTPTLKSAAGQIKRKMKDLGLDRVFISSDCSQADFKTLKSYLRRVKVYRFTTESQEQKSALKDGGIAIIDQIVCSHARFFLGTYESTFTFRIYEEREIMGFPQNTTYNTLCKYEDLTDCSKNSVWTILY